VGVSTPLSGTRSMVVVVISDPFSMVVF
jgi:hypothetical protein